VQELLDRREIHDVLMDYLRGVDRGDAEMIDSAYHPGAEDTHSTFSATAPGIGATLVKRNTEAGCLTSAHRITNEIVRLNGDVADAESYFHASMVFEVDGQMVTYDAHGRYVDRFERRGHWKIAKRQVLIDYAYYTHRSDWRPDADSRIGKLGLHTGILTRR
jgi:hypothetical protein